MSGDSGDVDSAELIDRVFRVLSDAHRQCALYYLSKHESATLDELATVLTGWVQARRDSAETVTPEDRQRVRLVLHHVHLPLIEDEGFVRYDFDSGEVELDTVPRLLEVVLDRLLTEERQTRTGDVVVDSNWGDDSGATDR